MSTLKSFLLRLQRGHNKGQSFVELVLVVGVLLTLLLGMVEFSFLLNTYITVVDAARQGARFASTKDPNNTDDYLTLSAFYSAVDLTIEGQKTTDNAGALSPILLNASMDDIIVSTVTVTSTGTWTRTPAAGHNIYGNGLHTTQVTNAQIQASITADTALSPTGSGLIIIEIFYACSVSNGCLIQIFPLIQGPAYCRPCVEIYTYTVMPMASVKP